MFGKQMIVGCVLFTVSATAAQGALVHQYKASDYTTNGSAVWADAVGTNDLTNEGAASTRPILVASATPTGQSAVQFDRTNGIAGDGGRFLGFSEALSASFTSSPSFAIAAVIQHDDLGTFGQIISGNDNGDLQLRVNGSGGGGVANVGRRNLSDVGDSNTAVGSDFIVLIFTYDGTNWAFYRNGAADGAGTVAATFSTPELVGTGPGISDSFVGKIAELRLYDSAAIDVDAVNTDLTNTYLIPEPGSLALLGLGGLLMLGRRRSAA